MNTFQIILIALILLMLLLKLKNKISGRSLKNYSSEDVKQMMKENKNIVLVDVRTERERSRGGIKGSIHIPLHEISSRLDEFKKYESREIICYCQSGARSVSAALKLKKSGFNSANMLGGYGGWAVE